MVKITFFIVIFGINIFPMKKSIWFLIFILLSGSKGFAQQQSGVSLYGIQLDTLAKMVKKHPKYFTFLQKKFVKNPEKMEQDEMILMYYGSAFLPEYHPKKEDEAVEKVANLMGQLDFESAVKEGENLIDVYPLNARLYMLLGYAYKKMGIKDRAKLYYNKYADLLRIPLYSGKGKDFKSAFVVRIVSDEYLILNQKDLELVQQELRYHNKLPFDVLLIKPKSKNNERMTELPKEKLYFNVYLPFYVGQNQSFEKLQEEAKRKYKMKE
jgi:tetratricopeptide (TPR) repeat protein